jgi:hypothetical protein
VSACPQFDTCQHVHAVGATGVSRQALRPRQMAGRLHFMCATDGLTSCRAKLITSGANASGSALNRRAADKETQSRMSESPVKYGTNSYTAPQCHAAASGTTCERTRAAPLTHCHSRGSYYGVTCCCAVVQGSRDDVHECCLHFLALHCARLIVRDRLLADASASQGTSAWHRRKHMCEKGDTCTSFNRLRGGVWLES